MILLRKVDGFGMVQEDGRVFFERPSVSDIRVGRFILRSNSFEP